MASPHLWPGPKRGSRVGCSRHTYDSLAAHRPLRAALASSPRRVVVFSSQHASASSSTPPTALQQRLAEAGVADWQAFCQPRYSMLATKSEVESIAGKVVELCREGLAADDIERLFQQYRSPWTSDLQQVFLPNMAYLRELLAASRLPNILHALDALMSQEGAGVELIIRSPMVAAIAPPKVEKAVQQLLNLGLDMVGIRELVSVHPDLLMKDLEGPVQQQKLQWAQEQLGWPLDKVLWGGLFNLSLRRMASRLAFRRQLGLPDPGSLRYIGKDREPVFLAQVSKATGREVSTADFADWVAAWLRTPEGQRWGFKPEKPKRTRQPKG
ncbi:hypothetical protein N2152v2_001492 [Parachlorella kessleri]